MRRILNTFRILYLGAMGLLLSSATIAASENSSGFTGWLAKGYEQAVSLDPSAPTAFQAVGKVIGPTMKGVDIILDAANGRPAGEIVADLTGGYAGGHLTTHQVSPLMRTACRAPIPDPRGRAAVCLGALALGAGVISYAEDQTGALAVEAFHGMEMAYASLTAPLSTSPPERQPDAKMPSSISTMWAAPCLDYSRVGASVACMDGSYAPRRSGAPIARDVPVGANRCPDPAMCWWNLK